MAIGPSLGSSIGEKPKLKGYKQKASSRHTGVPLAKQTTRVIICAGGESLGLSIANYITTGNDKSVVLDGGYTI